jgi:hypothetical protein
MAGRPLVNAGHTRTEITLLDDIITPPDTPDLELGVSRYTESNNSCPPAFIGSALLILLCIIITLIGTLVVSEKYGKLVYGSLILSMNWSLIVIGFPMLFLILEDGSQNSISGIVAQRLKPKPYFTILFICFLAVNTSNLTSASYLDYSYRNYPDGSSALSQSSFIMLYCGPLLMCLILIYPLIVRMPLHAVGVLEALRPVNGGNIEMKAFREVNVVTHTMSVRCSELTHFLSVVIGILCSWIGIIIELNNQPTPKCKIGELVFLCASILGVIAFGIWGYKYPDSDIYATRVGVEVAPRILDAIQHKNRIRILFEFIALWSVFVSQSIIAIDYMLI